MSPGFVSRVSVIVGLSFLVVPAGCKKKAQTSDSSLEAITGVDVDGRKKALSFIAVQNNPEISIPTAPVSERSKAMVKMPFLALVECSPIGANDAQQAMRTVERLSGIGNLFVNKARRLFSYGEKNTLLVSDCVVTGDRLVSWPVFANAMVKVGGIPQARPTDPAQLIAANSAYTVAQAFYLAVRGPYFFDSRAGSGSDLLPRLVQMANSYSGFSGSRRDDLVRWFKSGDRYFNPCHGAASTDWFVKEWRTKNFTCDRMKTDHAAADYFVGSKELGYPTVKLMLIGAVGAMHNELYADGGSKEDGLWDALSSTDDWSSLKGPGAAAAKYLAGKGSAGGMNLTSEASADNPLTLDDGRLLTGAEIVIGEGLSGDQSGGFALDGSGTTGAANAQYIEPLINAFSGVMMAPKQQATVVDFKNGQQITTVKPPTLQDDMVVFTNQPRERTMPNGQKMQISDMDYYQGLFQMQRKATNPQEVAAINTEIGKLMDQDSLKFKGVHRSGANEYAGGDGVRSYVHNQAALESAFKQGYLSKNDVVGGNSITWQKTGQTANGQQIDKLISSNPNKIFETYQVGGEAMAFKFKRPDGTEFMVDAKQDPRAKAAGYAVPDASSQERLATAANQNLTEFIKSSTAATRNVDALSSQVSQFDAVKGDTWSSRMSQYYAQMQTASAGSQELQRRNNLEGQAAAYGENYINSMRGVPQNSQSVVQLAQTSALVDMARANRESIKPSAQYQDQFNSAFNGAAWGAAKDSYETGKQTLSSMATSVSTTANRYASNAWNYMTGSSGSGSSSSSSSSSPSQPAAKPSTPSGGAPSGGTAPPSGNSGFSSSSYAGGSSTDVSGFALDGEKSEEGESRVVDGQP